MTKTYTITVRDLSNEAAVLDSQKRHLSELKKKTDKKISILMTNHTTAIASYLNHQLDEVQKICSNFYCEFFSIDGDRVKISNVKGVYTLSIMPNFYSSYVNFFISRDNIITYGHMLLSDYPYHIAVIMNYWKLIKEALVSSIDKKISSIEAENKEREEKLKSLLKLYENFEI